jgi:hypothetical protein
MCLILSFLLSFFFFFSVYSQDNKWIVVTTINHPTAAIRKLASQKDWHIVIVGDKKTPKDWNLDNCVFLDVEHQNSLGFRITNLLPYNHYSRKNIGYLYAIKQGATIIYDTDDDNMPSQDDIFYLPQRALMHEYSTQNMVVNPYVFFDQPTMWPRGYPLDKIKEKQPELFNEKEVDAWIQQGLVDNDPDVDAIYRLTRGITFNKKPQYLSLPHGTQCPFNSQNTIFHYQAFWGLLIPITTTFRVCDIWRGYFAQRLLWDIGGSLCFLGPTAIQERNPHNLLADFIDEIDLYTKAGNLVNFLNAWHSTSPSFFERIIELTDAMVQNKYYLQKDAELIRAWLEDLKDLGYQEPSLN